MHSSSLCQKSELVMGMSGREKMHLSTAAVRKSGHKPAKPTFI